MAKTLQLPVPSSSPSVRSKSAELPARIQDSLTITYVNYDVTVFTGDVDGAGTDGDVWIWLDGEAGRSGWQYLDNPGRNDFERGSGDYFPLRLPDVGKLTAAFIYFRPGGDWFLSGVSVNDRAFVWDDWLTEEGWVQLDELGVIGQG
jgi:hypothetical protein